MECKYYFKCTIYYFWYELIETLWNVNPFSVLDTKAGYWELIETLWNVNVNHIMLYNICLNRINRNIVECKFILFVIPTRSIYELIETLWNVNSEHFLFDFDLEQELIETLWNVNIHTYVALGFALKN